MRSVRRFLGKFECRAEKPTVCPPCKFEEKIHFRGCRYKPKEDKMLGYQLSFGSLIIGTYLLPKLDFEKGVPKLTVSEAGLAFMECSSA